MEFFYTLQAASDCLEVGISALDSGYGWLADQVGERETLLTEPAPNPHSLPIRGCHRVRALYYLLLIQESAHGLYKQ